MKGDRVSHRPNPPVRLGPFSLLLAATMLAIAAPATADEEMFEAIRKADLAMAQIGYRLATANAPLCDRLEPGLGLVLHTPEQYARGLRGDAIRHFKFKTPVAVEAVIPGSPAARAGIEPDDSLVKIGTAQFPEADLRAEASTSALIRAADSIAALPATEPVEAFGQRDGQNYVRAIDPVPACRTRFELLIGTAYVANADGRMVQISSRFFEDYPADLVAAVVAHELAHNILHHRERLEERGVAYGMLSGFGRNVRYFRQTELEADRLSVSLLANAGYDPAVAIQFWQKFGPGQGGILRSRSHPAWRDRVNAIRHAIDTMGPERPHRPALLQARTQSLDGDWQSLMETSSQK